MMHKVFKVVVSSASVSSSSRVLLTKRCLSGVTHPYLSTAAATGTTPATATATATAPAATPASPSLPGLTPEQLLQIEERDFYLRSKHNNRRNSNQTNATLASESKYNTNVVPEEADDVRRRRLLYRSKQRGWLEVDLLLGSWASKNINTLTSSQLDEYEDILTLETVDIFHLITGNTSNPNYEAMKDNSVLQVVRRYAAGVTSDMSTPDSYAISKRHHNLT